MIILGFLVLSFISVSWAGQVLPKTATDVVDAGNATCPVSGDKVNPKVSYIYEGKKYHFCCAMCIKDFKKDPKKYIAQLEKGESQHDGHMH
ncbi:MAG: YHS domain-containing protein [Candidatus Omnitrophica bacterium]|nr:YHS domain-containing protein [Candidatus Omnitrophota bacterium]